MSVTLRLQSNPGAVEVVNDGNTTGGDSALRARRRHRTAEVSRVSPVPMDHHEKMRLRAAAFRVTRLYPGPVGEMLSRELLTWEEFGYRLGGGQLVMRLVDHES